MNRLTFRWLLVAGAVALAGCETVPTGSVTAAKARAALEAAPLCCSSLVEAKRQPLPLAQPADIVIDTNAPAFDFGGVKAYFALFELPDYKGPYSIVITSLADGPLNDAALFIPRVALYDAGFGLTRHFDEKTLRNRGNNLERTIFINPSNKSERFIALYGSDMKSSIDRAYSVVTVTPVFAGPVMFNMVSGGDGKSRLHSSPVGKLTLDVQGLARPAPAP